MNNICDSDQECCDSQTIEVSGSAKAEAKPDQATLSAQVKTSAKTTEEAISQLT